MAPSTRESTATNRGHLKAVEIIQSGQPVYRGSLIRYSRRCGSPRCKCAQGQLHQGWALSMSVEGKTQVVYISDELRREVAAGLRRHEELRKLIERISKADTKKLRMRARRNKKR
jgi:hypothetical protein